jgi:3-phenylpropionate/trans-cinnamate dioxygenase ferredoxin subunit
MRHIDLALDQIPEGRPIRVEDGGDGILVLRIGDSVSAFEDVCPHAQWRLSDGELVDGLLECPGHGWEFSPETGRCVSVPAYCLKPIAIELQGNAVRLRVADERAGDLPGTVGEHGTAHV